MKTKRSNTFFALALAICFLPAFAQAEDAPTTTIDVASSTEDIAPITVQIFVRYEDLFVFDGLVPLTSSTSSALVVLQAADATSSAFSLSDVVYYESFDSYLVNCIEIAASTTVNACYNWNYIVNGAHPQVGMDDYMLAADDVVYVYFSTPWRLTMPTTTVFAGATTTFETWVYQYDNLAEPWAPDPATQVTVSAPNPAPTGWWDATLPVATITSNDSGIAETVLTATGSFFASITAPDFSKWSEPISFSVLDAPLPAIDTATTTSSTIDIPPDPAPEPTPANNGGGGGSSSNSEPNPTFNVSAGLAYLASVQQADGSIGNVLYSDWAAIAFGAVPGTSDAEERLKAYLVGNPSPGLLLTDMERRAMALMALGINPYTGTATNYIQIILASSTNGQFGEEQLFNDDIFAFFPLLRAGVSATDRAIASSTAFILSFQDVNGSWGSTDMTAAAVQALSLVQSLPGVPDALARARAYLLAQQNTDGGFDNDPFASSWAMQAIASLGIQPNDNFLVSVQSPNGSVSTTPDTTNNRIWATSYAIPAALGKPWGDVLLSFTPPAASPEPSAGSGGYIIPPQQEELATSTATNTATSTPSIATTPSLETPAEVPPTTVEQQIILLAEPEQFQAIEKTPDAPPEPPPIMSSDAPTDTTTPTTTSLDTLPVAAAARRAFTASGSVSLALGLYLVWRFMRTLL